MENEKNLNSVLKDVLNVSIDYLNVVLRSIRTVAVASPSVLLSLIFRVDLVDGSF